MCVYFILDLPGTNACLSLCISCVNTEILAWKGKSGFFQILVCERFKVILLTILSWEVCPAILLLQPLNTWTLQSRWNFSVWEMNWDVALGECQASRVSQCKLVGRKRGSEAGFSMSTSAFHCYYLRTALRRTGRQNLGSLSWNMSHSKLLNWILCNSVFGKLN